MNPPPRGKFAARSQMDPSAEVFKPGKGQEGGMGNKHPAAAMHPFHMEEAKGNTGKLADTGAIGDKEKGYGEKRGSTDGIPTPVATHADLHYLGVHENNMGGHVGMYSMEKGPLRVMNPDPASPREKKHSPEPESANPHGRVNRAGPSNDISGCTTPVDSRNGNEDPRILQIAELRAFLHHEMPAQPQYPVWNQPAVNPTFPLLPYYHNRPDAPGGLHPQAPPVPERPNNPGGGYLGPPADHQAPMGPLAYNPQATNDIHIHSYVPVEFRRRMRTFSGEITRPFRHFGSDHMEVAGIYPVARVAPTGPAPLPMGRGRQRRAIGFSQGGNNPDPVAANWNEYRNQRVRDWLSDIGD